MRTLTIQGDFGHRITITVHRYEHDVPLHPSDAEWLVASVDVTQGSFRGFIDTSFRINEFSNFLAEIDQILRGEKAKAVFSTMEETLAIHIEIHRTGNAVVLGTLRDQDNSGCELSFHFESNLPFLMQAQTELKAILTTFPGRTMT